MNEDIITKLEEWLELAEDPSLIDLLKGALSGVKAVHALSGGNSPPPPGH